MSLDFGAIFRLHDGRIAELWVIWDNMAALAQWVTSRRPQQERTSRVPLNADTSSQNAEKGEM